MVNVESEIKFAFATTDCSHSLRIQQWVPFMD
jgi:hypothetical protein